MDLRGTARRLRTADGLSARQIGERLGVPVRTVARWLEGLPVPAWTARPNAKDDVRARAVDLRAQGWSVPDIARELGVSRSTAWLWVKELPIDPDGERARAGADRRKAAHAAWARRRKALSDQERRTLMSEAAAGVGPVTRDDLLRIGAFVYWCEGAKHKPWHQSAAVQFANSHPRLIRLFLSFLAVLDVPVDRCVFRVAIHETADAEGAIGWWAEQIGVAPEAFRPPTIKRHNPRTNRLNRSVDYRGCLSVYVRRGSSLYWRIEGMVNAVVGQVWDSRKGYQVSDVPVVR
jgi:transcriptional regulator with XRE-family HTH domain